MSWIESAITVGGSVLGSGVLVAVVQRLQRRDVLDAGAAKDERREETHRVKRADTREAQLHDECREEVRKLGERLDARDREYALVAVDLARCEERHVAVEERLSRLEARSDPPPAMEPAE